MDPEGRNFFLYNAVCKIQLSLCGYIAKITSIFLSEKIIMYH